LKGTDAPTEKKIFFPKRGELRTQLVISLSLSLFLSGFLCLFLSFLKEGKKGARRIKKKNDTETDPPDEVES